jgi:hypothetical protein
LQKHGSVVYNVAVGGEKWWKVGKTAEMLAHALHFLNMFSENGHDERCEQHNSARS